jgi:hypothetical protein
MTYTMTVEAEQWDRTNSALADRWSVKGREIAGGYVIAYILDRDGEELRLEEGDWLVRYEDGVVSAWEDSEFRKVFKCSTQ